jgi:hypothetical protein
MRFRTASRAQEVTLKESWMRQTLPNPPLNGTVVR